MTADRRFLFDPKSRDPFQLSRSKLELFRGCPRCFYLDRRLGITRVSGPSFTLNSAVDALLKKEFDIYRRRGTPHPLMTEHRVKAIPFAHPHLDDWRNNFRGVRYLDRKTNFLVYGAIDDLWVDRKGTLFVVDYKSTSTGKEITLEDEWKQAYKRQMEIYQWLLRRNGFDVSDTGYFVYVNAIKELPTFDGRLEFAMEIIPYRGSDRWIRKTIDDAKKCLVSARMPKAAAGCAWCRYRQASAAKDKKT